MGADASESTVRAWLTQRLPDDLYTGEVAITIDRDEILLVGPVGEPELEEDASDADRAAAGDARIARFREQTRGERVGIAREAEHRFERKVAWGARSGEVQVLFTHLSIPVMTRLRLAERVVLDTLVDAGVARSRSDALAWCVRWVAANQDDWLGELRDAFEAVEAVRSRGPRAT